MSVRDGNRKTKMETSFCWSVIFADVVLLSITAVVMREIIMQWAWFADDLAYFYVTAVLTVVRLFCKAAVVLILLLLLWLESIIT